MRQQKLNLFAGITKLVMMVLACFVLAACGSTPNWEWDEAELADQDTWPPWAMQSCATVAERSARDECVRVSSRGLPVRQRQAD